MKTLIAIILALTVLSAGAWTIIWEVPGVNADGSPCTNWIYSQLFVWTNDVNHTKESAITNILYSATVNPPNWTVCSATFQGAPGAAYWFRVMTVAGSGESSFSDAVRTPAPPGKPRIREVKP